MICFFWIIPCLGCLARKRETKTRKFLQDKTRQDSKRTTMQNRHHSWTKPQHTKVPAKEKKRKEKKAFFSFLLTFSNSRVKKKTSDPYPASRGGLGYSFTIELSMFVAFSSSTVCTRDAFRWSRTMTTLVLYKDRQNLVEEFHFFAKNTLVL